MTGVDFGWHRAVQAALEEGDTERVRTLACLAGHLLDLSSEMPPTLWTEMYEKVSQRYGVKPTLTLIKPDTQGASA